MAPEAKFSKKQIMADPIAAYCSLHPADRDERFDELEALWEQFNALKKKRKAAQLQARMISAQIGTAKREGAPIDALNAAMQKQSSIIGDFIDALEDAEKEILKHFNATKANKDAPADSHCANATRIYPATQPDCGPVSVSLLHHDSREWNAYVRKHPAASVYHRAEWREIIQQS
jgi:hypothetical protein